MRTTGMSPAVQQLLAAAMFLIGCVVLAFVAWPSWTNYREQKAEVGRLERELQALKDAPPIPRDRATGAVAATPAEPSRFLGAMRALARESNCRLIGLESQSAPAQTTQTSESGETTTTAAKAASLVKPVRAKVTVTGPYPHVRWFLIRLGRAPRLYTITDLQVRPHSATDRDPLGVRQVEASVTVERYLTSTPAA